MQRIWPKRSEAPRNELEALAQVSELLYTVAREELPSPSLLRFLSKRVSGAREVLRRRSSLTVTDSELRMAVEPSGDSVDAYFVRVSRHRMKCTCWDSVKTSYTAQRRYEELVRTASAESLEPVPAHFFSQYTVCKHTLALLARLVYGGYVDLGDRELVATLRASLLVAYLASEEKPKADVVAAVLKQMRSRWSR